MKQIDKIRNDISLGNTSLGIEFGSTRIKAVLIDSEKKVIASSNHNWENHFVDDKWIYYETEIWEGIQKVYSKLKLEVNNKFNLKLTTVGNIGISAMMHGLIALDKTGELLVDFRTWRNNYTAQASFALTEEFNFNIPERWTISHLTQALMDKEDFTKKIDYVTTLSGYIHYKLTGSFVLGMGDASGVFPIDPSTLKYNEEYLRKFKMFSERNNLIHIDLLKVLPKPLKSGNRAGKLTASGAKLLDKENDLKSGIDFCPPEGDSSTGMVATNTISIGKSNISVGTSIFSMTVLEKYVDKVHKEIDYLLTPNGEPIAMIHANNCTTELNEWTRMFKELLSMHGVEIESNHLYESLLLEALEGDTETGNLLAYSYYSGENITKVNHGIPMFIRLPNSKLTISNFMQMLLFSAFTTLRIGMNILFKENVSINQVVAHGGLFKTPKVAQKILASILDLPVTIYHGAGEGGAWGMALLAANLNHTEMSLDKYLDEYVFNSAISTTETVDPIINEKFKVYFEKFEDYLVLEQKASSVFLDISKRSD